MSTSVTKFVDDALKVLLYTRYGDILGMNTGDDSQDDKIDRSVIQAPREMALRKIAEKRGEDFLEFINFWRVATGPAWDRQRTPLARRGVWLTNTDAGRLHAINVKAQPVNVVYNAWFWSKDLDKVYQCVERYIFWQQDYPKIDLTYTFDDTRTFSYSPELQFGEIQDESTTPEEFDRGIMHIWQMPIKIDAWVLDGYQVRTITKIQLTVYDKDSVTNYSEIVVPDSSQDVSLANQLRLSIGELYAIDSLDLDTNSLTVPNDRCDDFLVGDHVRIQDSTSNDNSYVVNSVTLVDGKTVLGLTGALIDSTVDGVLYKVG